MVGGRWTGRVPELGERRCREVETGQGGVLAFAAGLEGFELVHVLEELAMLGALVAHDVIEVRVRRDKAAAPEGLDVFGGDFGEDAFGERAVSISLSDLEFLFGPAHVGGNDRGLVALNTPAAP